MATLDYTGDSVAGAGVPNSFISKGKPAILYRRLNVPDIIAADSTMTTNGYITADDIIQAIHIKDNFFAKRALVKIVTACTASVDIDVGLAGGDEFLATFSVDGAAGTWDYTTDSDTYENGIMFTANDTIDVQFKTANCAAGCIDLYVEGILFEEIDAP